MNTRSSYLAQTLPNESKTFVTPLEWDQPSPTVSRSGRTVLFRISREPPDSKLPPKPIQSIWQAANCASELREIESAPVQAGVSEENQCQTLEEACSRQWKLFVTRTQTRAPNAVFEFRAGQARFSLPSGNL